MTEERQRAETTDEKSVSRRGLMKLAAWSGAAAAVAAALPATPAFAAGAAATSTTAGAVAAAASAAAPSAIVPGATAGAAVIHGADFAQSNYCWYLPKVTTLKNVSYVIDPMTSTKAGQVPAQPSNGSTNPFALMRLGPNNSTSGQSVVIDGLTLTGTKQPYTKANPDKAGHNYHGLSVYWGRGAKILNSKFVAAAWGDANSPPGETFQIMGYRDTGTYISNVDVDGRTADGTRVGGSPMGFNASTKPVIEDSYLHHSLVSSLTFSTAGAIPTILNATSSPTTRRVRIEHNANTKMASGYRFTGINHEHVLGTITHERPSIIIDWSEWTASHMWFGTWLPSARVNITIDPNQISGGHPNHRGALTLAVPKYFNGLPNLQKLFLITVKNLSGKTLKPYLIYGQPSGPLPIDKSTHYVVNRA